MSVFFELFLVSILVLCLQDVCLFGSSGSTTTMQLPGQKKNVAATMAKESTNGKKENSQKPLVIWFLYNTSHVN